MGASSAASQAAAALLRLGTLRGFRHFELRCRSREEVLLTVPACDEARLQQVLSRRRRTPGADEGAPVVAPLGRAPSTAASRPASAVFLLAAYTRYRSAPYVWLRACSLGVPTSSEDLPLELGSTGQAAGGRDRPGSAHAHLAAVLEELLLAVCPPTDNVFAVDGGYVEALDGVERACCQAALVDFLHSLLTHPARPHQAALQQDMDALLQAHCRDLA